ncbi:MAG: RNA-binding domain-containing protein [Candidatus Paceibacterota bacterium]
MNLQELVARARLLFEGAPKRRQVFNLVNGKKSGKELARKSGKSLSATLQDLQKMKDLELITFKINDDGTTLKKENSTVYEQAPLLKHLPNSYFDAPEKVAVVKPKITTSTKSKNAVMRTLAIPSIQQILDICCSGEDQLYEFKSARTIMEKLSKEVCAFANTKQGGIIFYGVEDDGAIENSDVTRQKFDQSIQNSIKYNITPTPAVKIIEKDVLGYKIILIIIPSWNKKDVHHFQDAIYIRRGTNVFKAKADEARKLHNGEYVI